MKSTSFLFILLGLFWAQNAFCQDFSTLQWGVYATPTYNNVLYTGKHPEYVTDIKEYIKPTFGYVVGTNIAYRLNEKIGFETGLSFQKKGFSLKNNYNFQINDIYYSLNAPVKINYFIGYSRLSFIIGIGTEMNYILSYKGFKIDYQTKQPFPIESILYQQYRSTLNYIPSSAPIYTSILPANVNYNKFHITSFMSFGINYKLNDRVSMRIEPVVRYEMLRSGKNRFIQYELIPPSSTYDAYYMLDNDFARDHIWSVGLNTALYFNL